MRQNVGNVQVLGKYASLIHIPNEIYTKKLEKSESRGSYFKRFLIIYKKKAIDISKK